MYLFIREEQTSRKCTCSPRFVGHNIPESFVLQPRGRRYRTFCSRRREEKRTPVSWRNQRRIKNLSVCAVHWWRQWQPKLLQRSATLGVAMHGTPVFKKIAVLQVTLLFYLSLSLALSLCFSLFLSACSILPMWLVSVYDDAILICLEITSSVS